MIKLSIQFDIVIPAYNAANTIKRCLDSIDSQTYNNYSVIIINDGSTDNTDVVVEEYITSHPQMEIHYIVQANSGAAKARYTGIQAAAGDYVCFLDADDAWNPNKLTRVNEVIKSYNVDVIYHDIFEVSINKRGRKIRFRQLQEDALSDLIINGNQLATSSVVAKRDKLLECNAFSRGGNAGEDIECWVSLARHGATFRHIPEVLSTYFRNRSSLTMNSVRYVDETSCTLMGFYDYLSDKYAPEELESLKLRQTIKNNIMRANFYFQNECWKQAAYYYKKYNFNQHNLRSIVLYHVSVLRSLL